MELKHVISVDQFSLNDVNEIFSIADKMRDKKSNYSNHMKGLILGCLFYESSTRTSSSFLAAIQRLGGGIIPITQGVQYSSVSKGETLEDTIKTLERYCDFIVLRHPDNGSAERASKISRVPIINAGDGNNEHPTQALLDMYTISRNLNYFNGRKSLTISVVGDLKNGRTIHSLIKMLALYGKQKDIRINCVSPSMLRIPRSLLFTDDLTFYEINDLNDVIKDSDVIYMTRVQKERMDNEDDIKEVLNEWDKFIIKEDMLKDMKYETIIMHPLPRIDEIEKSVDDDSRAIYFDQVENGMFIRMALLSLLMG